MSDNLLKQAVQAQFAGSAEAYVTSSVHANQADLQRMVDCAQPKGDEHALDIATGGGHTALAFAPHVRDVIATDLTPAMLAAAERFITGQGIQNVRFQLADAEALPFDADQFEIVTCRTAPHHFADVGRFVREVARVLRPNGVFVLVDTIAPEAPALDAFINEIEQLRDPTHVRDYTVAEWRAFCATAGLTVERAETFTKAIPFADWCSRARVSPPIVESLEQRLSAATPEARAAFSIELKDRGVQQFALHALLLAARKG